MINEDFPAEYPKTSGQIATCDPTKVDSWYNTREKRRVLNFYHVPSSFTNVPPNKANKEWSQGISENPHKDKFPLPALSPYNTS